jgi:hypothetical protein
VRHVEELEPMEDLDMKKKSTSELPPTEKIDRAEMADVMKS